MTTHIAHRILATPNGSGLSFPLRMFDKEEDAKDFLTRASQELGSVLETYMVVAPGPRGPTVVGSFKELLMELLNGPFSVKHQIIQMEPAPSELAIQKLGLVDPRGKPI